MSLLRVPVNPAAGGAPQSKVTVEAKHKGHWLPHPADVAQFVERTLHRVRKLKADNHAAATYTPAVQRLADLINSDPIVRMYFQEMISQDVVVAKAYRHSPYQTVEDLLDAINHSVQSAPIWEANSGLVGFPLNAVLDYCMATAAGYAAFRDTKINHAFKDILDEYGKLLLSPASTNVLVDSPTGWFCPEAIAAHHLEWFVHEPAHPHKGFHSWNDFFIRKFKEGMRPVAEVINDKIIVSSCESSPFALQHGVKLNDRFWVKGQPYSLHDMLGGDALAGQFLGGTVYQAFLSALKYHRWHSPVNGKIVKDPVIIPGTYYSEAEAEGFDEAGPDKSQGYITAVAARGLVFIQADDPVIGLMAILYVGMAEVSSCIFGPNIKKGHHIKKGEELGYFQFGGSTHCLIFRPNVLEWIVDPKTTTAVLLNAHIATARSG